MASADNRDYAERVTFYMEQVAREEAERTGFDMNTEPHALFRMMMVVLTSQDLTAEAMRRFREEQEK